MLIFSQVSISRFDVLLHFVRFLNLMLLSLFDLLVFLWDCFLTSVGGFLSRDLQLVASIPSSFHPLST